MTFKITRALSLLSIFFALILPASGNEEALLTASRLAQKALDSGLALEIATDLATEIGPRLYGSEDERRAVEWAAKRFREYGFDKIWTESFPVDRGWERCS